MKTGLEQIAIFLSNFLLLINYEGSAEKLVIEFFFLIFILVQSVTANIEMTPPPPMIGLHMTGKISRCRGRQKDVCYLYKIAKVIGRLNGIVSFSSAHVNVYNIL